MSLWKNVYFFFRMFSKIFKRNVEDVYNYLVMNLNDANLISTTSKKWKFVTRYINHMARWSHGNVAACYAVYTIFSHTECSLNFSLLALFMLRRCCWRRVLPLPCHVCHQLGHHLAKSIRRSCCWMGCRSGLRAT